MNGNPAPAPPPRWFWLLPLLALAAWWPISPMWQSDDFIAVNYAGDFGNVLHDFVGPQYGAQDIWLFYRPLITLSFWLDGLVGGADPWFAHFSNTLAHAVNALLVGLIWLRFASPMAAFAAGALWCLQPAHAGAVSWAVGRVDSHTTVWCLLSVWLLLRHLEGSRPARWLSLGAFALALASKELAFAVPLLLVGVTMLRGEGLRPRLRLAVRTCAPHLWLLFAYFAFRRIVLGVFVGGYSAATFEPVAMVVGLGKIALHLLNPLLWTAGSPGTELFDGAPGFLVWIGFLPALLALAVILCRRQFRGLLWGLLLFLVATLPTAPFWMDPSNVHNLRYFYFPCAALAGMCASAGRSPALLALMVQLPALVAIRIDYVAADRQSAAMLGALRRVAPDNRHPLFVAGMPHTNRRGTVIQLHFGVDRMFARPFAAPHIVSGSANRMYTERRKLYALRPLAELPAVFTLGDDGQTFAVPGNATATFAAPGELVPLAESSTTELPLEVLRGPDETHLEATADLDMRGSALQDLKDDKLVIRIRTPGVRPQAYRITFFTATGYLCSVVANHGAADATEGHIGLRHFLAWACCARAPVFMMRALEIPAIHDLDTDFPVLVEAGFARDGEFDDKHRLVKGEFVASHRAGHLLTFRCDRRWPAMVRAILGQ